MSWTSWIEIENENTSNVGHGSKTQEVSLTLSGFCTQTQKSQWVIDVGTTG